MSIPYPKQVILNVGTLCGYACIFCLNSKIRTHVNLSFENIKEIMSNFSSNTIIDISGYGEVMLRSDFIDIVNFLKEKNIKFNLSTSGEPLTEELQEILRTSTLNSINFSLNSLSPIIKKILSGNKGDFNQVMKNFINFVKLPRDYAVSITMVVTRLNFKEMYDFAKFGIEHGVNMVGFYSLDKRTDYPSELLLIHNEELVKCINEANDILEKNNIPTTLTSLKTDTKTRTVIGKQSITNCKFPWNLTVISPSGNVTPCCLTNYIVGNIKQEKFEDIWNGEKINDLRAAISKGDNKFCKNCPTYE